MDAVLRALAVYLFLMIVFRIAGRRTLMAMTSFDFILLLILSEATQNAMIGNDYSMTAYTRIREFDRHRTTAISDRLRQLLPVGWNHQGRFRFQHAPLNLLQRYRLQHERAQWFHDLLTSP